MNTKNQVTWVIIALLVIVGLFVWYFMSGSSQPTTTPLPTSTSTPIMASPSATIAPTAVISPSSTVPANWLTAKDSKLSLQFSYPKDFSTTYIKPVDWPPKIQLTATPFTCTPAGSPIARGGQTQSQTINNHTYCVTTETEGAAGSIYTMYAYAEAYNNQTAIFTFSIRAPQCANYPDPQKTACQQEQATFDINSLIDQVIQSLRST